MKIDWRLVGGEPKTERKEEKELTWDEIFERKENESDLDYARRKAFEVTKGLIRNEYHGYTFEEMKELAEKVKREYQEAIDKDPILNGGGV